MISSTLSFIIHMRVKAEDEKIPHLHIESQNVQVQMYLGQYLVLRLALAISVELAENKNTRFHQFSPNVQP